jgi:LAO/AO transport system kinase
VSDPERLATRLVDGDRRALARSITLVESTRADHRSQASALLDAVLARTGGAIRLGITGTPGAGKSTFIEELGGHLTAADHRVAVLAVDPTSRRSGGSILGDKTRMERLARDPHAFIRPSPSGGSIGGVARRTRQAALLCEAAGFDVIIVETVGVGQSEVAVADMVDCFCLIAAPGAGDELQGIKRGIMELADVVVVNKADGDLLPAAQRAIADYRQAVHLLRPKHPGWQVPVLTASALQGSGIDDVWVAVEKFVAHLREGGALDRLRAGQAVAWMWDEIRESLVDDFRRDGRVAERWAGTEEAVRVTSRDVPARPRRPGQSCPRGAVRIHDLDLGRRGLGNPRLRVMAFVATPTRSTATSHPRRRAGRHQRQAEDNAGPSRRRAARARQRTCPRSGAVDAGPRPPARRAGPGPRGPAQARSRGRGRRVDRRAARRLRPLLPPSRRGER